MSGGGCAYKREKINKQLRVYYNSGAEYQHALKTWKPKVVYLYQVSPSSRWTGLTPSCGAPHLACDAYIVLARQGEILDEMDRINVSPSHTVTTKKWHSEWYRETH